MRGHAGLRSGRRHSHTRKREEELKAQFPELNYLALSELFGGLTEFSRSLTRLKVLAAVFQRRRPGPHPLAQRSGP